MRVTWTKTAIGHLDAIYGFIAQDSPTYALNTVDKITRRSQQISEFPFSGRKVPEYETNHIREVIEGSYRIIYLIKSNQINILVVIHGSQDILKQEK